jgi:hypothetical protein
MMKNAKAELRVAHWECGFNGSMKKVDDAALLQRLIDALPQAEKLVFGDD